MLINSERIQELFNLPPVEWEEWANAHPQDIQSAVRDLEAVAQFAVRLSEYLDIRERGGGHKQAVKESNKTVAKVRKAMGFTYSKQDIMF